MFTVTEVMFACITSSPYLIFPFKKLVQKKKEKKKISSGIYFGGIELIFNSVKRVKPI